VLTDRTNCGGCGNVCITGQNCVTGRCECPAGQQVCGMACANVLNDAANCGACGTMCPMGQVCSAGRCVTTPTTRYRRATSTAGITYVDACAAMGAQTLMASADGQAARAALPFPFRFWATDIGAMQQVNIASSGWLNLRGGMETNRTGTIPSVLAPNGVIAPYWRDARNRTGVCVATVGMSPNRRWVVEWREAGEIVGADAGVGGVNDATRWTYEVILTEGTNTIDFVYPRLDGVRQAQVGIENINGTPGISGCPDDTVFGCTPFPNYIVSFDQIP
jgi:hypothetical protein